MRKSLQWPTGPEVRHQPFRGGAMLYDVSRAGNAQAGWFSPDWWAKRGEVQASSEGRGAALFINADGRRLVLRHYYRGGLIAHVSRDRYLWRDPSLTRSFYEWYLLYVMRRAGLPVPVPIAACYRRTGRFTYSGDLLTEQIAGVSSLAALLAQGPVSLLQWIAIGRCLRRFHEDGVYHADLNAHNIMLGHDQVWVLDFDRGGLRRPGLWCDSNLVRLRRSIEKLTRARPTHFAETDWASLLHGYFEALAGAAPADNGPAAVAGPLAPLSD